ncbi:MAG TPA: hypothetical protein EYQ21_07505 [Flavobacteriales bacterium]|nr:hypothetical protein [Flavobacteriales bacterium]
MARDKTTKLLRDMKKGTPTRNIPLGIGVEIPDLSGVASNPNAKIEKLRTSIPANRIPYSDGSHLTSTANLTYDGTDFIIDANASLDRGLKIINSGSSGPRITLETVNTYIQDEGTQFTIRGNTIVNQFYVRTIFESAGGMQELNIAANRVQVNAGTGIADFYVDGASGTLIKTIFATGALHLDGTSIGFYGIAPKPQAPPIPPPVGGGVVDVESRAAIASILAAIDAGTGVGLTG